MIRIDFDPTPLTVTHKLIYGSTIWPQSKQYPDQFPQGILRTDELPVALVPRGLSHFQQRGQRLFYTTDKFDVEYPHHDNVIWTYYGPWILFGFLNPDNQLTIAIPSSRKTKEEKKYEQDPLL